MSITIYSTTICAACHSLTKWLDSKDIKYEKKITDTDPAIMQEFMEINDGMIGVPFSVIKEDDGSLVKISGFDQGKFKKALNIQ